MDRTAPAAARSADRFAVGPASLPAVLSTALATAAAAALLAATAAAQSPIERVSVDSSGQQSSGTSGGFNTSARTLAISHDHRYVVFESDAEDLVTGDANRFTDLYVRDRLAGTTQLLAIALGGGAGRLQTLQPAISADGRFVAFVSGSDDLVIGDANNRSDLFLCDRDPDGNGDFTDQPARLERLTMGHDGSESNGGASAPSISADGMRITFTSDSTNLVADDANGWPDIFLHDRASGITSRVSVDAAGGDGNGPSDGGSLSSDGLVCAFLSSATDLVGGDTNGFGDIFVRDLVAGTTTLASRAADGGPTDFTSLFAALSADGRYVSFASGATNVIAGDANAAWDVFRHDRATGETLRASIASNGSAADLDSGRHAWTSISGDGQRVCFLSTARNLAPNPSSPTNLDEDVFVHDFTTGETLVASSDLVGVSVNDRSTVATLSHDGSQVAFVSHAATLVDGDTNNAKDVFVFDRALMIEASVASYGAGTSGTLGVPAFDCDRAPEFGASIELFLGSSAGAWTVAFVAVGLGAADLPFVGGSLLVDPIVTLLLLPVAPGGSRYDFEIPYELDLHGTAAFAQLIEFDAGATKGLALSAALELRFGR